MAKLKSDGGCHCHNLTYEAEIDPEQVEICHCTDCQSFDRLGLSHCRRGAGTRLPPFDWHTEDLYQNCRKRGQAIAGVLP